MTDCAQMRGGPARLHREHSPLESGASSRRADVRQPGLLASTLFQERGERMRHWLLLPRLRAGEDWTLLALRLATGAFLLYGVWDNITSQARMDEFVGFLHQHGFAAPAVMARLSVWAQ